MPDTAAAVAAPETRAHIRHRALWHRWSEGIYIDVGVFALVLLACSSFYLRWGLWEDQSAQVYMTWGLFHGMRPYVDLIDPNWPGILLPHTLAYLFSGVNAWGLRLVDLVFQLMLLIATSWILWRWNVPRSLRIVACCAYLLNYFATGWWWTAQRESFCWPVLVVAIIPFLQRLSPQNGEEQPLMSSIAWLFFGTLAGLSLWIKPVGWLALLMLLIMTPLLCDRKQRSMVFRRSALFILGIAMVSLVFIAVMAATGTLGGFIKWGIRYDLGPYSQVKWPWPKRLTMTAQFLFSPQFLPLPLLLSIAGCVVAIALRLPRDRWHRLSRPLIAAAALLVTCLMAALLQGKTHSLYHFIPTDWALAFFAGSIWALIPWGKAFNDGAMVLTVIAVVAMLIHGPASAGPTPGEIAADRVRPTLLPQDQIVLWGYEPSMLARLRHRTPFQTFIGTSFLITSPPDSWAAREVLDRLNRALKNPAVRYLFVDQNPCVVIQNAMPYPRGYLTHDSKLRATLAKEYRALPDGTLTGFDVLEHLPAYRMAPAAESKHEF